MDFYCCSLVLARFEQFGYEKHATIGEAREEAKHWIAEQECSAVEIVYVTSDNLGGTVVEVLT